MISVLQLRPEAQSHSRMSHQPASSVSNISDSGSEQTRSSLSSMSLGSSISDIDMLLAKRRFVGFFNYCFYHYCNYCQAEVCGFYNYLL